MPRRAILSTALLLSCIPAAHAQPTPDMPPPIMPLFDDSGPRGRKEETLATMDAAWREFMMKNTRIDQRGFLAVTVPAQFLGGLDAVKQAHAFVPAAAGERTSVAGMALLGTVQESPNRKEFLFGSPASARALLTAWKFKEDGGSINVVRDFLNQTIDGMPATLSLATTQNSKQCHWKVGAVDDRVSYEVIIADALDENNAPGMTVSQVVAQAQALIGFARQQN